MPSPFSFFAGAISFLTETDDSLESVIEMIYMSMSQPDRSVFVGFLLDILKPSLDTLEVDSIWIKAGRSVGFDTPEHTVDFLRHILSICVKKQQLLDLA